MSVSSLFLSGIAAFSLLNGAQAAGKYALDVEYSGHNFFNGFDFFQGADPTHRFFNYVDQATAASEGLTYVDDNGEVHIGVDSKTVLSDSGIGRDSVRITTKDVFNHGLFILDLTNMPGGACGTWPAWWSFGPNWPASSSMDIIEGVNKHTSNLMSLQTGPNCTIAGSFETGTLQTNNCDEAATCGVGCGVSDNQPASYGTAFNTNNGGVYATEWTSDYIRVWFFPRGSIPSDITAGNPDPSTWGTPDTNFQGGCDIDSHFINNNFVFDTTFCGDWAGSVWSSDSECSALAPTCEAYVAANPDAFKDMYWAIKSMKVYTIAPLVSSSSSSASSASTSTSTSSSESTASSSSAPVASTSSSGPETTPTSTSSTPLSPPASSTSLIDPPASPSSATGSSVATPPAVTTSTVLTTSVYTITSCAPTVTDCPARMGSVTTDIITQYTTFCPGLTSAIPASSILGIHAPVVSYTTVIVTSYFDVCPEGTLSTHTTSQTQVVYVNVPGVTETSKPVISMVTSVKTAAGEAITVTVPYEYPTTTPVPVSATPTYAASNVTLVSTTGAAVPQASQFTGMASGGLVWSQGAVFACFASLLMLL